MDIIMKFCVTQMCSGIAYGRMLNGEVNLSALIYRPLHEIRMNMILCALYATRTLDLEQLV